jgi:methionyl-tRNA formyltransferase
VGENLRIVFAGTPANAATTLQSLLDGGFDVVGVLTREDAAIGRKKVITPSPVAEVATKAGIAVFKSNSVDDPTLKWLAELDADLGVIVAYGSILRSKALAIPSKGWINLHYSLLPDLPGAAPVQWALLEGRKETGVTVFELDEGVDTGPIYSQQAVTIPEGVNAGELLEILTMQGIELLSKAIQEIASNAAVKKVQDSHGQRKFASKLDRSAAKINFSDPSADVLNVIRAMNPEPMAWFEFEGVPVRVLSATKADALGIAVGVAVSSDQKVVVGCADGAIELLSIQPAGKVPMSAIEWFRGLRKEQVELS